MGNAKNKGNNKNKRIRESNCVIPVSLKFLLETAKFIKEEIRKPVKLE